MFLFSGPVVWVEHSISSIICFGCNSRWPFFYYFCDLKKNNTNIKINRTSDCCADQNRFNKSLLNFISRHYNDATSINSCYTSSALISVNIVPRTRDNVIMPIEICFVFISPLRRGTPRLIRRSYLLSV